MVKYVYSTIIALTLILSGCATVNDSQKPSQTSKHCEATNTYAEASSIRLQQSLQNEIDTRGTTVDYTVDSCKLLQDETKALSLITVQMTKEEMIIGELVVAVFLQRDDKGEWEVVNFGVLTAQSYENKNTNNKNNKLNVRDVTHL